MRYTHRYNPKIQAHRLGDAAPDWVADLLATRQVIVEEAEDGPIYKVPSLVAGGVVSVQMDGRNGDYLIFDGSAASVMDKDEFEAQYDPLEVEELVEVKKPTFVDEDSPVLVGTGVITKDEMAKLIHEKADGAVLIGNPLSRGMFFPAIIAIDYKNGRVIYDRDMLINQVYKHSNGSWEEAQDHVVNVIEKTLEDMTNDENRNHMPLIVEKQECY